MREQLLRMLEDRPAKWSLETFRACFAAGLVEREADAGPPAGTCASTGHDGHSYVLSASGLSLAKAEDAKRAARRKVRNSKARGRAQAMRDLGLRRTTYGWE
jgi:hypothetical protein